MKLFFNGCSFVAGDALVWDEYLADNRLKNMSWPWTGRDVKVYENYKSFRGTKNLPAQVTLKLNKSLDDLIDYSDDGNSNENIAITTINFFNGLPKNQRSSYYAIIGWSSLYRRLKWDTDFNNFLNLTSAHILFENEKKLPFHARFSEWIKASIVESHDADHLLNYASSIMLLENYFLANGIRYIFWRSLGESIDLKIIDQIRNKRVFNQAGALDLRFISNPDNWIKFDQHPFSWLGNTWYDMIMASGKPGIISITNHHPNKEAIDFFSTHLANSLRKFL